jgi:preprotein translocase subunit SecE
MKKEKSVATGDFVSNENAKEQKNVKKAKNKNKKPGFFKRMGLKIKDIFSELKKVNWPTFAKVVKQTGIVLAVVLVFLVVITAFDTGLLSLLRLISPSVGQ